LSEAVAGDEAVKVIFGEVETFEVIPSAHVFARGRQAGFLAKDFQQAVVVNMNSE
jgi:hypothetical protein